MSDLRVLEVEFETPPTTGSMLTFDGTKWNPIAISSLFYFLPVGVYLPYGGSSAPTGWLICDGSAKSRTDYALLFDAIGTTFGAGDGSTTFNLPDAANFSTPFADGTFIIWTGVAADIVVGAPGTLMGILGLTYP